MIVQDEISLTKVKNGVDGGDGKDGTNGKDGENGKDSNTHTAYSWSADGSDRFTTMYPNENLLVRKNEHANRYLNVDGVMQYNERTSVSNEKIDVLTGDIIRFFKTDNTEYYRCNWLNDKGELVSRFTSIDQNTILKVPVGATLLLASYPAKGNNKIEKLLDNIIDDSLSIRSMIIGADGNKVRYFGSSAINQPILLDNATALFLKKETVDDDNYIRYVWIDSKGDKFGRNVSTSNELKLDVPNDAIYFDVSYPTGSLFSVSFIDKKVNTIYTPSPKDDFNNAWPTFIGTYSSHDKVQSQNPKDYTWARIRGADGSDGKDGQTPKDVISGYLSNEAIIVPATPTGNVTDYSKAFGDFIVSEGQAKLVNGVTYSKVSEVNMTSTINSAGRYVVTALSADTGTATYRATYAGVTVDKILIVVKNKQGPSGANGEKGDKGDKGDKGAIGNTGPKGDPTGITVSPTVPTNPYINMLWQNTGSSNGYLTGTVYQWNGAKWNIFIFSAENIVATTLSALSAYLGNVQGGSISGAEFINTGEFFNPSINKKCSFETSIKGPISTNYSEKDGPGKGHFYLSPVQVGGSYSKTGNIEKEDHSWSLGDTGAWFVSGNQADGDFKYANFRLEGLKMFEERFNRGSGDFELAISDIAKYPPTQLDPAPGYSIYSVSGESLPTAKRSGRAVTLSGAFKNNSNVSTDDTEILLGRLPKWAVPKDVERTICQGSGMNRFILTVRPNGNIYWSRYGNSSSFGTAGAGAWLSINIRYDGVDL